MSTHPSNRAVALQDAPVTTGAARPCHIIDASGRVLCGTPLPDPRPHALGECFAAGHERCQVCNELDGGVVLTTDDDWLR